VNESSRKREKKDLGCRARVLSMECVVVYVREG